MFQYICRWYCVAPVSHESESESESESEYAVQCYAAFDEHSRYLRIHMPWIWFSSSSIKPCVLNACLWVWVWVCCTMLCNFWWAVEQPKWRVACACFCLISSWYVRACAHMCIEYVCAQYVCAFCNGTCKATHDHMHACICVSIYAQSICLWTHKHACIYKRYVMCRADQIGREAVLSKEISRQKEGVQTSVFARSDVSDEQDTNTE